MKYRLAIWDFDGTILDTRRPITMSINRTLSETGRAQRDVAEIQQLIGLPLPEVMRRAAKLPPDTDAASIEELCDRYRTVFKEMAPENAPMFAGVREALAALREAGVELAVATSRSRQSLEMFFDQHDLRADFRFWAGGQCVARGKPNPDMLHYVLDNCGRSAADAVMIGDTTHDMEMGHAAGVHTCAVTYGMHDVAQLEAVKPTYLVHGAHELPGVVLSLS